MALKQEGNLCAQHCLNALLQGPYFTAIDLAELARQLDQREQDALGNPGSRDGKSQNMDDSGFFSVQVLSHALSIWNIQIVPWGAKEVSDAKAEPEREAAFICNLEQHWYTLRRFGPSTQRWYDLNSMHPRPQYMSATYLGMTLSQLEAEGYSIFVVRPLAKEVESNTTVETQTNTATANVPLETVNPTMSLSASSSTSTSTNVMEHDATPLVSSAPPSFLSERQEMERIRRQRLEQREKASQQVLTSSASPAMASTTVLLSSFNTTLTGTKRTRVDQTGENPGKETRRPSTSVLVTTPSFLPRCEVDDMAAKMPLETAQESQRDQPTKDRNAPAFGGAGYRLGGPESQTSVDIGVVKEDDEDLEAEMMQQAIALSLQGAQK
ncbi:Ataxin-3 [Mortierella sp. GBA30]|nr:Ataxin-3 [Mortierella sp. GBA30]